MKYRVAWNEGGKCRVQESWTPENPSTEWMKPYTFWMDFPPLDALAWAYELRNWGVEKESVWQEFKKVPGFFEAARPASITKEYGEPTAL